ncbi:PTS sugar transporter subunit IIB [Coprobacillus sp. AF36-10BH]|nr:PTS sugar transporter subunit IIB [Coprobacillus sp. AF36-10BH]
MEDLNILLVCGGGMSSGFVAKAIRKAARNKGYSGEVIARGHSEIPDYINVIDALLIGPHFAELTHDEDLMNELKSKNITVMVMDAKLYSQMNGEKLLEQLLEKRKEEQDG